MTTLTGGFTQTGFDASAIEDGDESGATGSTSEKFGLSLVFDNSGNIVFGANGSYLLATLSNCTFTAETIGETDGDDDGFVDTGPASLVSISGTKGGSVTFTYDFGSGGFGTFTGTLSADGTNLTGTDSVSDDSDDDGEAVSTVASLSLVGSTAADFANNLKTLLQNAGINGGPSLLQNLPEVMFDIQSTMRTMGLTWSEMGPIIQSAQVRSVLGNVIGPAISAYMTYSQYETDLANRNPSIWINAATNIEKILIGTGAMAISIAAAPVLTPLGSLALGLTLGAVQTLADSWLTTQLNSLNANIIPVATSNDFALSSPGSTGSTAAITSVVSTAPSLSQTTPQTFDPGYYVSNHPDAVQAIASGVYKSALAYYLDVGLARGDLPYAGATAVDPSTIPDAHAQAVAINSAGIYFGIFDLAIGAMVSDGVSALEKTVGQAVFSGPAAETTSVQLDATLSAVANRYAFDLAYNQGLVGSVGDYFGSLLPNLSNNATLAALESAGAPGFTGFSVYVHSALSGDSIASVVSGLQQDMWGDQPGGTQPYGYGVADVGGEWVIVMADAKAGTAFETPPTQIVAGSDFSGFGTSDVLLRSGDNVIDWMMEGGGYSNYNPFGSVPGYSILGSGDFNGDGVSDVLLQSSTGQLIDWNIKNGQYAGYSPIGNANISGYGVIGVGDYSGVGTSSILLENAGGNLIDWSMSNGQYSGWNEVGNTTGYGVVGKGDFNGDGTTDILLQGPSGNLIDWMMTGGKYWAYNSIGNPGTAGYGVVGTGDFNADGTTDLLLENGAGNLIDWTVKGGVYAGWNEIGNSSGYGVVGTGDYNGDGTTDVLLENGGGNIITWSINNGVFSGWHGVGNASGYGVLKT